MEYWCHALSCVTPIPNSVTPMNIPTVSYYYGERIVGEIRNDAMRFTRITTETGRVVEIPDELMVNYPLPSGSARVPFDDWFMATGTSSDIAMNRQLGKNNCIYCRCRIFDSDRFCPACGGPIYD